MKLSTHGKESMHTQKESIGMVSNNKLTSPVIQRKGLTQVPAETNDYISMGVGRALQQKLKELGSNPRKLSAEIGYAYDHVRKVCKGQVYPGERLIKTICEYLEMDADEMLTLVQADKALEKGWVEILTEEDPLITKIKRSWDYLTATEKKDIVKNVIAKADLKIARG
jgi:predicted transcriptional regulator